MVARDMSGIYGIAIIYRSFTSYRGIYARLYLTHCEIRDMMQESICYSSGLSTAENQTSMHTRSSTQYCSEDVTKADPLIMNTIRQKFAGSIPLPPLRFEHNCM